MHTAAIHSVLRQGAAACRDCAAATVPELPAPNKSRATTAAPAHTALPGLQPQKERDGKNKSLLILSAH